MSDPRTVTIAFAGDTTDIDQKFNKLKDQAKDFGLELEQITKKIGSVQTVTSTLLGADGKNIVTTFANVNAELKLVAPNAEKAIEALKDLEELNLKQGGSLGITQIVNPQFGTGKTLDERKKLAEQGIALLDKETAALDKKLKVQQELTALQVAEEAAAKRKLRQSELDQTFGQLLERQKAEAAYIKNAITARETAEKAQRVRSERENKENEKRARQAAQNYAKWWQQVLEEKHSSELRYIRESSNAQELASKTQKARSERENKENETRAKRAAQDYKNWWAEVLEERYRKEQEQLKQLEVVRKQIDREKVFRRQAELKQIEDEKIAQLKLLEAQAATRAQIFKNISGKQAQFAKTSALGSTDNELVTMRANIAQQEIEIERRKNQKLLGLEIALQKDKIALVRANERRNIILQNYEQELIDLQAQKNKLRALEVKSTKSAGGYGLNFGDMAARVLEINVLWNAINKLNAAVSNAVSSIIPLGIQLDATKASLQSTAGGTAATTEILQALTAEAQRTGIEIGNLRQNFRLFQASTSLAGASMEKTWKMFTDLNTVSAALHLTTDQTNSVFLAMAQIFNKGKVQAEELVRQLGNLLPGAFASFAAANNMTTQKLIEQMEKGRVYAQDTMEKFTNFMATRFSGAFATASQALNADIGRMNSEFQLLGEELYRIVRGPVQTLIRNITELTKQVRASATEVNSFSNLLSALNTIANVGTAAAMLLITNRLLKVGTAFMEAKKAATLFEASIAFLKTPMVWVVGITAGISALEEYILRLNKARNANADFVREQMKLDEAAKAQAGPPALRLKYDVENSDTVKTYVDGIKNIEAQIEKVKAKETSALSFSLEELKKYNQDIRNFWKISKSDLGIPIMNQSDSEEARQEKLLVYYNEQLKFFNKKLELTRANVTKEKEDLAIQEEKAAVTNEFGEKQEVKRLDQIKARLAEAEYQKTVAEQAKDWDKVERINREILNLERQKTEETKKGSEVAERIKKIYENIEILGKRDREKGLNASEKQRLAELTTELTQLREIQRGFNAEVDKAALLEQARLKQKQTTEINKELPLYTDEARTAIEEAKTDLAEQTTRYKEHKISLYEYYESVRTLRTAMINEEITAHQKRMELMTADDERRKQEVERIRELEQEKKTIVQEVTQSFNKDLNEVSSLINDINTKYLESVGKYGEAGLSKAQEAQREQIATLESIQAVLREDLANPEEPILAKDTEQAQKFLTVANQVADALQKLKTISFDAQAEGFFKEFQNKEQFLNKDLAIKEIILRTKQKSGAITEFGALLERQQNMQDYIPKMQEEIQKLEDRIMAAKDGADEATLGSVEKWRQELNEKKALLAEFAASSELIADRFQTIFTEAFGTAFANFVTGTTTAAEAFQNFAKSVIASLANIAAQEYATQIFSLFKTVIGGIAGVAGTTLTGGVAQADLSGLVDAAGGYPFAKGGIPAFEDSNSFFDGSKNKVNFASGGIPAFDSSNSFFEDFKNKMNFASGGIPDIGSVKQTFMMANGGVGTLRERGPEAILPLQRDSKGNLGVAATQTTNNEGGLQIGNIQINVENKKEESGPDLANTIAETLVRRLADEQIQKASRPGNLLNKTTRFGNG